ncbi:MAG: hypothetical protein VXX85_07420 [Candidatus Margulisiibacteriota bacterium]|nr:hypothetical protein [Candidatus Margulisiibacteriota bacterium]
MNVHSPPSPQAANSAALAALGVHNEAQPAVNKPTISSAEQTTILNTIQAGLIPHPTNPPAADGSLEVDHFMSLLDKLSTDSSLSSGLKEHINSIKNTFLAVENELHQQPLPINDVTVQKMVPNMLSGIQQLFELFDGFDGIDESVKGIFSKVSTLAKDCSKSFLAGPPNSTNMVNHVKRKANYFLNKKENSPFDKNNDVLTVIMVFADVNSSLKLLCPERDGLERPESPNVIPEAHQPVPPVRTTVTSPQLESSNLVNNEWEFSTVGSSNSLLRICDFLNDLNDASDHSKGWSGTVLKDSQYISESALRDLEQLNKERIEQLRQDLKDQLLENLQRLKDQFDLSDLNLSGGEDEATINQTINALGETDIRKVVQGHIDLLNGLKESS